MGGKVGGFNPDDSDAGVLPDNDNHRIYLRGATYAWRAKRGDYADERPPLMVGVRGSRHLWLDNQCIGATGDGGDAPATLYIMPRKHPSGDFHNVSVSIASEELNIERLGTDNAGIRSQAGADAAIQWYSGAIRIRTNGFLAYQAIVAQALTVSSEQKHKKDIHDFDALNIIKGAPAKQYKYKPEQAGQQTVGISGRWLKPCLMIWCYHPGPDPHPGKSNPGNPIDGRHGALTGVTWEGLRQLTERVEALENAS